MQHPHNLCAGRMPDKVHRVLLVPHRIVPCGIDSPEPFVAASLAVILAVVHLPALEVVEQLARPAAPRTIKSL
jgi:hypothetical protein